LVIRLVLLIGVIALTWASECLAESASCLRCHDVCHGALTAQQHHEVSLQTMGCVDCHRGNPTTQRRELAHYRLIDAGHSWYRFPESDAVKRGQHLVDLLACRRCHVLAGKGNSLAAELDRLYHQSLPVEVVASIRVPAFFMPDFSLQQSDVDAVVNVIFAAGFMPQVSGLQPPQVVHFENDVDEENLFEKHCGRCHRVLTAQQGGLGTGDIAPNLSGLLSQFYPKTFKDNQPWDVQGLKKWIKNPRAIRPLTRMLPVVLREQEAIKLIDETWPLKVKEPLQ
jgi:cytochrome c2